MKKYCFLFFLWFCLIQQGNVLAATEPKEEDIQLFLMLLIGDSSIHEPALTYIDDHWRDGYLPMVLEVLHLNRNYTLIDPLVRILEKKTKQKLGYDINRWYNWLWNQEPQPHPYYADFKSILYSLIDPKFKQYFNRSYTTRIRLDEVRWGGVLQDGIPPLRNPKMIKAEEADYLEDSHIIFGLEVNGDIRAYPKRILAWHEMFVDDVGGEPVVGVYCTLCGTMILYKSRFEGTLHQMGTSGFLYRSNKLMYDQKTQSLWNTLWGQPVIGELADKNIALERLSVVTTTWGEWRRRHPQSQVLSLDTGHGRNYDEGVAYQGYFATDELMFTVPKLDKRLKNKDEVLGLIFSEHPDSPLAISAEFLMKHPLHHDQVKTLNFVIFTDKSGANRVYETQGIVFKNWNHDQTVVDDKGISWELTESRLTASDGRILHRLPAHRAFWFGWYSAYAHTRLVF